MSQAKKRGRRQRNGVKDIKGLKKVEIRRYLKAIRRNEVREPTRKGDPLLQYQPQNENTRESE